MTGCVQRLHRELKRVVILTVVEASSKDKKILWETVQIFLCACQIVYTAIWYDCDQPIHKQNELREAGGEARVSLLVVIAIEQQAQHALHAFM